MSLRSWLVEKLNPAQPAIQMDEGFRIDTDTGTSEETNFQDSFNRIEIIRRGVDMIAAGVALFNYDVADQLSGLTGQQSIRKNKLSKLLNHEPNPYQTKNDFMSNLTVDLVLEGNAFIYWDGAFMYHLPASRMEIVTDPKTFVKGYTYLGSALDSNKILFAPEEIIHVKDNSSKSIYRGTSRLMSCGMNIAAMYKMLDFQSSFFKNGTVPGMVLESDNPIPDKIKLRLLQSWAQAYNPRTGGKRPLILDNGLKSKPLVTVNFQELDFNESIDSKKTTILEALGVPAVLLNGGNNANITPNLRLFYLETVMPIVRKFEAAFERYFGYDIKPVSDGISALQPDILQEAQSTTTLVNGGVITPNEARERMRKPPIVEGDNDKLRVPANIAGSAAKPDEGGRPTGKE